MTWSTKMLIEPEQAQDIYSSFNPEHTTPTLAPPYVVADALRESDLDPKFWLYDQGTARQIHGFHLRRIAGTDYFDIQSPYGYGGPLTNDHRPDFLEAAWKAWRDFCARERIVCEFIRFHPVLENWRDYRGLTQFDRETVLIWLKQMDLSLSYAPRTRTVLRKAERAGYRAEWIDQTSAKEIFPEIYYNAMRQIAANREYFFSSEYLESLLSMPSARCAVCRDARGKIVAASLFLFGPKFAEYHLSGATPEGRTQGAPTVLIHAAAQLARDAGCIGLYLGGGTSRQFDDRLLFFKSSFSPSRRGFYIGRHIHSETAYEELKSIFPDAYERFPNRILFYRISGKDL